MNYLIVQNITAYITPVPCVVRVVIVIPFNIFIFQIVTDHLTINSLFTQTKEAT